MNRLENRRYAMITAHRERINEIIRYADLLVPAHFREVIGGIDTITDELMENIRHGYSPRNTGTFLEEFDLYGHRKADTITNKNTEFRDHEHDRQPTYRVKDVLYYKEGGNISFQHEKQEDLLEPLKIMVKGSVHEDRVTDDFLREMEQIEDLHPQMPEFVEGLAEICPWITFSNNGHGFYDFKSTAFTGSRDNLKFMVAQIIILWDVISYGAHQDPPQEEED
jgi:hypothetical protein